MTTLAARWSRDLVAVVATALLGLIVALIHVGGWIEVVALLPLVLVLPGYALAAALFGPGAIPLAERTVYVVALSLTATGLGGIITQLVLSLDRLVWAVVLFLVTLAASRLAQRRRDQRPNNLREPHLDLPSFNPLSVAVVLAALAISGWAVSIAGNNAKQTRHDAHFTELWVLPVEATTADTEQGGVTIGVSNHEGHAVSYRVRVAQRGASLAARSIRVQGGRNRQIRIVAPAISAADPLQVTLLRKGQVYHRAFLRSRLSR